MAITQPTYLPWLGYFDLIDQVDVLVILDSVQFEKRSWQQRNRIKMPAGLQWLTVPVAVGGRRGQLIDQVEILDRQFWRKHLRSVELNYRRAPFFEEYFDEFSATLECSAGLRLVDLNVRLIKWFMTLLGIGTPLLFASQLGLGGKRTELLANICSYVGASTYLSPIGSAVYLLEELETLESRSIEVLFHNYEHPRYQQLFPPFVPYASVIDLLFNEGPRAMEVVRMGRGSPFSASQLLSFRPEAAGTQTLTFVP